MRAVGLRSAVAILIAGTGVSLAVGAAHAETAAPAEREASDAADSAARDATSEAQRAERLRERRERRYERMVERIVHARAVLFEGIELSAEQSRGVDAIIEGLLEYERRSEELRVALDKAVQQGDQERGRPLQAENRLHRTLRKSRDETMEEMRALLSEDQRPTFDMNRARLVAESRQAQNAPKGRRKGRRPRADAEAKADEAGAEVKAAGADAEVTAE